MTDKTLAELLEIYEKAIALKMHPVGCYYTSDKPTDPGKLFGGTWEPIQDTFLYCAGPKHAAGQSGGEETHTLTVEEFPQHTHTVTVFTGGNGDVGDYDTRFFSPDGRSSTVSGGNAKVWYVWKSAANKTWGTNNGVSGTGDPAGNALITGGNQPHNNMPPFRSVYCWHRIA